jgi:hypothetical protein
VNLYVKAGIVLAGYAGAFAAALIALDQRLRATAHNPDVQASSGMYAFGDGLLFLYVFGLVALLPTALALYHLRPLRKFWSALAVGALALASTGLAAALVVLLSNQPQFQSVLMLPAMVCVLRLLLAPVLGSTFIVCALFAPETRARWMLGIAAAIECAAGAAWFLSLVAHHLA